MRGESSEGQAGRVDEALTGRLAALAQEAEQLLRIDPARAVAVAQEAYALATRHGHRAGMALARIQEAYGLLHLGDYEEAFSLFTQGLAHAEEVGATEVKIRGLNGRGVTHMMLERFGEALEDNREALRLVQARRNPEGEARTLNNIGILYVRLQEYEEAQKYHRDALELAVRHGLRSLRISSAANLAVSLQEAGDSAGALKINRDALHHAQQEGFEHYEAIIWGNLSESLLTLRQPQDALEASRKALEMLTRLDLKDQLCNTLIIQGQILSELGQPREAYAVLQDGLALASGLHSTIRAEQAHEALSRVQETLGNLDAALHHARAFQHCRDLRHQVVLRNRTQMLAAQLRLDRLEHQASEQRIRNEELAQVNAALEETKERLAHQAAHDALTGLLNRAAMEARLQRAISKAPDELGSVLFIDLDHFKHVNDTFGHPVGDELLRTVAARLRRCVREDDCIARQGGDEFMVLLTRLDSAEQAEQIAEQIRLSLSLPVELQGRRLVLTASIGLAMFPQDGTDIVTLQKNADLALYHAKVARHRVRRFSSSLGQAALERMELDQDLRAALSAGQLQLHYQPIVRLESRQPVLAEALLRWPHPRLGFVSPARFIPLAEQSGLITEISAWVVREAVGQLARWRRHWPEFRVSVNLSARDFSQPDFPDLILRLLQAEQLPPEALVLELTESAVLSEEALQKYGTLKSCGLPLALDDIGSGYSSLARLHEAQAQFIKIDRALIEHMTGAHSPQHSTRPLVSALITYARESGTLDVAEGVETPEQAELLRELGCTLIQGYLEARPMPAADLEAYLWARCGAAAQAQPVISRNQPPEADAARES